jgi:hypothetical protein
MMPKKHSIRVNGSRILAAIFALCASPVALAEYVPFPGKLAVKLLDVEAPNIIFVNFETWPGFPRSVRIILPGIVVPEDTPQADDCEREKAARAMEFARKFVADASKIYVNDMRMETSADEQAFSDILTDHGSLSQALKKEGLARADTVAPDTSWCRQ